MPSFLARVSFNLQSFWVEEENIASWLKKKKKSRLPKSKGGRERGLVWGQGRAGWGKSLQGFGVSEGSQPGQGGEEQCRVTLVGQWALVLGGGTDQDEGCSRLSAPCVAVVGRVRYLSPLRWSTLKIVQTLLPDFVQL